MKERVSVAKAAPDAYKAMQGLQGYVNKGDIEAPLLELVKIRASQINGCASCLAMHVRDARKAGESDERMHLLNAWDESPIYTARERAALAWTEAVTLVTDGHVPDEVFETARAEFSEKELVDLTMAIIAINGWNRLAISFRRPPETDAPRVNT
jgi:AhpD family alkylhydroperoxidase